MLLYHITPSSNLESIFEKGLIPGFNKNGVMTVDYSEHQWRRNYNWLTDDPEFIIDDQTSENWIKNKDPVILVVNCSGYKILDRKTIRKYRNKNCFNRIENFRNEFIIRSKISSNCIVNILPLDF